MSALQLEFLRHAQAVTVVLHGSLDGTTVPVFQAGLAQHVQASDANIVLDCRQLTFISSAGLREFLILAKQVAKLKSKVTLAGAQGSVAFALEIAGFNALFRLVAEPPKDGVPAAADADRPGLLSRLFGKTGAP